MHLLPAVSGEECVKALARAGFQTIGRDSTSVSMERGYRLVAVSLEPQLDEETIAQVLRSAGISLSEFLDALGVSDGRLGVARVAE
jgi:predicted RNA binding protein YcfA (HicA-like mRNA interferase family)